MTHITSILDNFYEKVFCKQDRPPGKMVDVGGYHLHFQASEPREGTPTVIVETGINDCSLSWKLVQSKVEKFAQIVTYDRAGYGWSDLGPKPRSFVQMNKELNQALKKLNIKPPYILVGHSLGGAIARNYQKQYPEEVVGIVLVDALHNTPPQMPKIYMLAMRIASYLAAFGILHLIFKRFGQMTQNQDWTPEMQNNYDSIHRCRPSVLRTCFDESDAMEKGFAKLSSLESIPVTLISRDPGIPQRPGMSKEAIEEEKEKLIELHKHQQEDFKNSRLVIAKDSSHLVQLDKPDIIVEELKRMIESIKE